jgi:hypothetical protein
LNLSAFIFTLAMAGPAAGATPAKVGPSSTATVVDKVRLEVDHSALLAQQMADAAEDSAFFVREDGAKALREQHGVDVVSDDGAPAIIVKLAWKDYEGSVYRIEISTRRPGEATKVVESFAATCINNTALTKAVVAKLPAALEQLAAPKAVAAPDPVVDDTHAEPAEEPAGERAPVVDEPKRVPLGPKGKAGIGLLAGGAVGVVTGGIVFAQQRRFDENDPSALDWEGRDFRPPGIGVMVAGGVVAVTGAVLLILDRTQARRARKAATPEARLVPTPTGFAVAGRF